MRKLYLILSLTTLISCRREEEIEEVIREVELPRDSVNTSIPWKFLPPSGDSTIILPVSSTIDSVFNVVGCYYPIHNRIK